jgi:hypothetical protein
MTLALLTLMAPVQMSLVGASACDDAAGHEDADCCGDERDDRQRCPDHANDGQHKPDDADQSSYDASDREGDVEDAWYSRRSRTRRGM